MFSKVKRETIMNIVRHGIFLLALYTIQTAVLPWIGHGGVPVLLAVAAAGVSHFEDSGRGAVFGLFAGLLCDAAFGKPTVVFTLVLTALGLVSGYLGDTLLSRRFPSYMLCCFAAMVIVSFVQMFSPLFFRGVPAGTLLVTAGIQTVTSLIFAIPIYPVAKWLARRSKEA